MILAREINKLTEHKMDRHQNLGGDSGVVAFEARDTSIEVQFRDGAKYLYNYQSTGSSEVEQMKKRAVSGMGLNSFITRHVGKRFASKR